MGLGDGLLSGWKSWRFGDDGNRGLGKNISEPLHLKFSYWLLWLWTWWL
jgi:hypothetical protein